MGFRSLDEVAEAPLDELAGVAGIGAEGAERARARATKAMEDERKHRLAELAKGAEMPSDRDRLTLIQGVSSATAQRLVEHGYNSPEAIVAESDTDRFALSTGLQATVASAIKNAAAEFVEREWPSVEAAIRKNAENVEAEASADDEAEDQDTE